MCDMEITIDSLKILNEIKDAAAENAKAKGFRDNLRGDMTPSQWDGQVGKLVRAAVSTANQHAESSEFWEAFRNGTLNELCDKSQDMIAMGLPPLTCGEEEIADELIRVLDKADVHGIDVAKSVAIKMLFNSGRPFLHGGKKA